MARGLAALFGSYALAALWGAVLAQSLPMSRLDATLLATILSFAIFPGVAVYVFAAKSTAAALTGLGCVGLVGFLLLQVTGA